MPSLKVRGAKGEELADVSIDEMHRDLAVLEEEACKKRELIVASRKKLKEIAELEEEQKFLQVKMRRKMKELKVSTI